MSGPPFPIVLLLGFQRLISSASLHLQDFDVQCPALSDRFYCVGFLSSGTNLLNMLRHLEQWVLHDPMSVRVIFDRTEVFIKKFRFEFRFRFKNIQKSGFIFSSFRAFNKDHSCRQPDPITIRRNRAMIEMILGPKSTTKPSARWRIAEELLLLDTGCWSSPVIHHHCQGVYCCKGRESDTRRKLWTSIIVPSSSKVC